MNLVKSAWRCAVSLLTAAIAVTAAHASDETVPPPADPLTATIHLEDAERFAKLFDATGGKPGAAQLQAEYLDVGSYGVSVFTPYRIKDAENLAAAIAEDPASYRRAIDECLPRIREFDADLRSIYLGLRGLYPDAELPQIYVVFGAGNSGGTAGDNAQVLGLEVVCGMDDLRTTLRQFFAHETVHALQQRNYAGPRTLLSAALMEGGADFVTWLVTGQVPRPDRALWAQPREAELWQQFRADMIATQPDAEGNYPEGAQAAGGRWIGNYRRAPDGWPYELGYWTGMRIWQSYFDRAEDKAQAVRDVLSWSDPEAILAASGYDPQPQ